MLDPDVVLRSDGGTALPEATVVLRGPEAVAARALAVHHPDAVIHPALVNGTAGVIVTVYGQPVAVLGITISHGKIVEMDAIADPDRVPALAAAILAD
jgi:hypothetical protein